MTVTVQRKPFTEADKEHLRRGILLGDFGGDVPPDLESRALGIAEQLQDVIRKLKWEDNSTNRAAALELLFGVASKQRGNKPRNGSYRSILRRG